jgi:chemotaxis protein histidine kinase CheA
MAQTELLDMLSAETDRRSAAITKGLEELSKSGDQDSDAVESLRVEAHGLKGAALVVGQQRLAELAMRMEELLTMRIGPGTIDGDLAAKLVPAAAALQEGARAAASGDEEPASVAAALDSLTD